MLSLPHIGEKPDYSFISRDRQRHQLHSSIVAKYEKNHVMNHVLGQQWGVRAILTGLDLPPKKQRFGLPGEVRASGCRLNNH